MGKKNINYIDPEKIHLIQIECIDVSIDELDKPYNPGEEIDMKIAHLSAHNLEDKAFLMGLDIILSLSERPSLKSARFRYDFHFVVDNLEQMYTLLESGEPLFESQFGATLAGISYSTLRGIVFEKLQNTVWGQITLPVVNPNKILDSWIDVE